MNFGRKRRRLRDKTPGFIGTEQCDCVDVRILQADSKIFNEVHA